MQVGRLICDYIYQMPRELLRSEISTSHSQAKMESQQQPADAARTAVEINFLFCESLTA